MIFKPLTVFPKLPQSLTFLQTLANNAWWVWNNDAKDLLRLIDPTLLRDLGYNPVALLAKVGQARLDELSHDTAFLASLAAVGEKFNKQVTTSKYKRDNAKTCRRIAYFSMEFGLHESIHIYSGGLGILAGDHLKSASDLDIPLVGVGLFYREGYFEQSLGQNNCQHEDCPHNDTHDMPVARVVDSNTGAPVLIGVPLPEGRLRATAWRLDVGRVPLFLLDTNIPENPPELRSVTGRLYGGDQLNRLRQEILLGIGGLRLLDAAGYEIAASHMNEGHAAFLGIERIAKFKRAGLSFDEALAMVRRSGVFTTHTPVPAGNETFKLDLLHPHLKAIEEEGGLDADTVLALGRAPGDTASDELSMTILGLSCSASSNGVAKLHGVVERDMWRHLWPEFPVDEVPIGHITNGVHVPTWLSSGNNRLYATVLGPGWSKQPLTDKQLEQIDHLADEQIWRVRESARAHLVRSAREHTERACIKRNEPFGRITAVRNALGKDTLTIGFARRFATYKRATLLLADPARLKRILLDPARPVQIIFAGKAHPADGEGKDLVRQIAEFARDPEVARHVVFLENYNMHIARLLVRGVDVWLNTPRRPNEASGTSGMKACINGAIHVSTLDGWWPEGYSIETGWAIGGGEEFHDWRAQDHSDAQTLYNLLESEIVPAFYDRPQGELPLRWIRMMKASVKMSLQRFSSTRMVAEYYDTAYAPALASYERLTADNFQVLRDETAAHRRVKGEWANLSVSFPHNANGPQKHFVGDEMPVTVRADLCGLSPDDVVVEFYAGEITDGAIRNGVATPMRLVAEASAPPSEAGTPPLHTYSCTATCPRPGAFGYSARIRPAHVSLRDTMPGYIVWAV